MSDPNVIFLLMLCTGIAAFLAGGVALWAIRVVFEKVFWRQIKELEDKRDAASLGRRDPSDH